MLLKLVLTAKTSKLESGKTQIHIESKIQAQSQNNEC